MLSGGPRVQMVWGGQSVGGACEATPQLSQHRAPGTPGAGPQIPCDSPPEGAHPTETRGHGAGLL